jgi:magnesium-transporting ATPase (P-type)
MKKVEKKPASLHTTSILWSVLTLIISTLLLFSIGEGTGNSTAGYVVAGLLTAIACFYIVKQNAASIWYAPVVCNVLGIIAAFIEPNFWITSMWMLNAATWALAVAASVAGAVKSKKAVAQKV